MPWVRLSSFRAVAGDTALGVGVAIAHVVVGGYLHLQARAVEQGVVFSWNLKPVFVTDPHVPVLQFAAIVLLAFLTLWLLYGLRPIGGTRRTGIPALVTLLALGSSSLLTSDAPPPSVIEVAAGGLPGLIASGATSEAALAMVGVIAAVEVLRIIDRVPPKSAQPGT